MIEENGIISQQVPGFDEWLWVLAYPGIKVLPQKHGPFCLRSIAVRIALRMDGIWPVLFTPVTRGSRSLPPR